MNACAHTYTKPQTSSTRSRGLGWRIHGSVEDTKLSTNKQHSLSDFGFPPTGPARVYEDNLACVAMSENPVRRKYSRHIDIRRYFVRDLVSQQILKLVPLRTNLMVADALTKSLPAPAHAKHRDVMIGRVPFCVRTLRSSHCVRGG